MKRCPQCGREYDVSMSFCLDDGSELLYGPASSAGNEPQTAILSEPPTRQHAHTITAEAEPRESVCGSTERPSLYARRAAKPVLAVLGLIIISGLGIGVYRSVGGKHSSGSTTSFESMKIAKLTDTGQAGNVAISPDGKYVVHLKVDAGQRSIWVRHIATGSNVQIIPPSDLSYSRMTFSRDGNYIYFSRWKAGEDIHPLFQVPVLGGEPKQLNPNVSSSVTFSPDGSRMAFERDGQDNSTTIVIANADGSGEKPLATLKEPEYFKTSGLSWSPDGSVIATAVGATDRPENKLVEIRIEDGSTKQIGSSTWRDIGRVAWLPDGSGIVATCGERGSNISQVNEFTYPGGEVRKITNDFNSYYDVSVTADSSAMVTVQENRVLNIWSAPDGDASHARQLTQGPIKYEGQYGLQWTPDGKIAYSARPAGTHTIAIMDADGSNSRQLTQNDSWLPAVTRDGRYIVFSEASSMWRMDINGGDRKQLTDKFGSPSVSPDGRWVVYTASVSGLISIWKVSIDGGEPVRMTDKESLSPAVSPDGKTIAYVYREQANAPWRISVMPFDGGPPTTAFDAPTGFNSVQINGGPQSIHWMPDGRSLAYIVTTNGVSNIWSVPIAGEAPKQLTNFTSDQIAWFDLSRDGKPNLFSRGSTTKDVVLISGFRK